MLSILLFLLLSSVKAQNYYQQKQQQYPYNNYNSWSPYSQNYPSWSQGIQQNRASVRGNLISDDTSALPYGSQITVSLTDVSLQDVASLPLNTIVLYGSYRFPIAFDIPYSIAQIQLNSNARQYAIQARIEKDGQLLYINDQYTPVQLNPIPITPVNVYMRKIATSIIPVNRILYVNLNISNIFIFIYKGIGGIYTTRPPVINSIAICQQIPDVGPCRASIEQYYFNTQLRSCQIFLWGGCGGNQNRFSTRDECERTCSFYKRRLARNNAKQRWLR